MAGLFSLQPVIQKNQIIIHFVQIFINKFPFILVDNYFQNNNFFIRFQGIPGRTFHPEMKRI